MLQITVSVLSESVSIVMFNELNIYRTYLLGLSDLKLLILIKIMSAIVLIIILITSEISPYR